MTPATLVFIWLCDLQDVAYINMYMYRYRYVICGCIDLHGSVYYTGAQFVLLAINDARNFSVCVVM